MDNLQAETLNPYKEHKEQAKELDLARHFALYHPRKSERIYQCGDSLIFDRYQNLETGDELLALAWAIFCKVKWCPMCAWRKARKILAELLSVFEQIEARYCVGYVFLTLTIKNPDLRDLRASVAHMSKSWQRLIQTKRFKKAVWGYIRALEFMGDETPEGQAHPHYHSVLVVPTSYFQGSRYIPQAEWAEMWQKALRANYSPIVDIRGVRPKKGATELHRATQSPKGIQTPHISPTLLKALCECTKYLAKGTKLAKLDQEQFLTLDKQAKGLRQYNLGGLVKSIKPIEPPPLDPSIWEFLEKEFYLWCGNDYKQINESDFYNSKT
ncbi:protein rep [Helicobacter felis]|uniref:protein rep n=1 Tax=Helicobacter felis TaxID=214 RepID=UPI000CEE1244|nr:protein rep [Helicobacter felis]